MNQPSDWSTLVAIAGSVIALAALVFAVLSFRSQQARAERHARANARPLLRVRTLGYTNLKAIKLINAGVGPAIVTNARFSKDGTNTNDMVKLFKQLDIVWETYINLPPGSAIPPQGHINLVLQSADHLQNSESNKYSPEEAKEILKTWQKIKSSIHIHIEYEDILGNSMDPIDEILK